MLRNHKGFFLVELLLSLSIWLLMTLSLLPIYTQVTKQSLDLQREEEAVRIMYEALQGYLLEGKLENGEVHRGSHIFSISWQMGAFEPQGVCVSYEDVFEETKQKCERLEL